MNLLGRAMAVNLMYHTNWEISERRCGPLLRGRWLPYDSRSLFDPENLMSHAGTTYIEDHLRILLWCLVSCAFTSKISTDRCGRFQFRLVGCEIRAKRPAQLRTFFRSARRELLILWHSRSPPRLQTALH
jgi:hypothetical protein